MRIEEMQVENYKALKKVRFRFEDFTTLVGENGSGKSTALEALEVFFRGKLPARAEMDHVFTITLTFSDLPPEIKKSYGEELELCLSYSPPTPATKEKEKYIYTAGGESFKVHGKAAKIGTYFDFHIVPADKEFDKKGFIDNLLSTDEESLPSPAKKALIKEQQLRLTTRAPAAKLNATLLDFANLSVSLDVNENLSYSKPEYRLTFQRGGVGANFKLEEMNDGDFRALVIALVKFGIPSNKAVLFAIDEPELYQHSTRTLNFVRVLNQLAQRPEHQVVIATHHYNAVDLDHHLVLFSEVNGKTKVHQPRFDEQHKKVLRQLSVLREFFFQKKVVLVEGDSDWYAIQYLMTKTQRVLKDGHGLFWMLGRPQWKRILPVLERAQIPYLIMIDGDYKEMDEESAPNVAAGQAEELTRELGHEWETNVLIHKDNLAVLPVDLEAELEAIFGEKTVKSLDKLIPFLEKAELDRSLLERSNLWKVIEAISRPLVEVGDNSD